MLAVSEDEGKKEKRKINRFPIQSNLPAKTHTSPSPRALAPFSPNKIHNIQPPLHHTLLYHSNQQQRNFLPQKPQTTVCFCSLILPALAAVSPMVSKNLTPGDTRAREIDEEEEGGGGVVRWGGRRTMRMMRNLRER